METLRPRAILYLVTIVLSALIVALIALTRVSTPDQDHIALAVALAAAAMLAQLFPLHVGAKTKLYLDTAILVAAIVIFEPGIALLIMSVGTVLAHIARRQPWDQTLFNCAQVVLLAAGGSALLSAAGWRGEQPALDQPQWVMLIAAIGVTLFLSSAIIVATMVAFQLGEPLRPTWWQALVPTDRVEALMHLAQVGLGILVAGVADAHVWMIALLLLPAAGTYRALAHHFRLRRHAEARLVHQSFHDQLTDLPNRTLMLDRLEQALARSGRQDEPVAVLVLDLDRFKLVNDRFGHAAGDCLLVAIADRLLRIVRPGDTVARLGGDEFTILFDGLADAREAERLTASIAAALEPPFALNGQAAAVTASIGLAISEPQQVITAAELLHDADQAMYRAKSKGKARYELFEPEMGDGARERAALVADLQRTLKGEELQLVYQPVVNLTTGRIAALEALARWEHPIRGPIPPAIFVPLAEEAGLIGPLGHWAVEAACRQARTWQESLPAPPVISVNLSPRQFQQPGLVKDVASALRATGLAPHLLALEITESAMLGDGEETVNTLRQLKGLGVTLALDDFGTGYSSLASLQRLPFGQLKVDRQFVAGLGIDAGDAAIVTALVGLARTLGLAVVAEGVETAEQAAWLHDLGCDLAQGFYFGGPQPAAEITALLEKVAFAVGTRRQAG